MRGIVKLDLSHNNINSLPENLSTTFPDLRELTLCGTNDIFAEWENFLAAIHNCPNLRCLRIDERAIDHNQLQILRSIVPEVIIVPTKHKDISHVIEAGEELQQCYNLLKENLTQKDALDDVYHRSRAQMQEDINLMNKCKLRIYSRYLKLERNQTLDEEIFDRLFGDTTHTDYSSYSEPTKDEEEQIRRKGSSEIISVAEKVTPLKRVYYILSRIFPIIKWVPEYFSDRKQIFMNLVHDIFACVMVTMVLVPQCIAFALVVGVPSQYGLFTAIIPNLIYPFLGTSKTLAPG
jgi:hypothetical protein